MSAAEIIALVPGWTIYKDAVPPGVELPYGMVTETDPFNSTLKGDARTLVASKLWDLTLWVQGVASAAIDAQVEALTEQLDGSKLGATGIRRVAVVAAGRIYDREDKTTQYVVTVAVPGAV